MDQLASPESELLSVATTPSSILNRVTGWMVVPSCFSTADFGVVDAVVVMVAVVVVLVLGGSWLSVSLLWVEFFCCCILTCIRLFISLTRSSNCTVKNMWSYKCRMWMLTLPFPMNCMADRALKSSHFSSSLWDIRQSLKTCTCKIRYNATEDLFSHTHNYFSLSSLPHLSVSAPLSRCHMWACHLLSVTSQFVIASISASHVISCLTVTCQTVICLSCLSL